MQDPLQQLGAEEEVLDELLFLLFQHGQHLTTFQNYFSNLSEYLDNEIVDLGGPVEMNQLDAFAHEFDRVIQLQDQICNTLLAIAERLEHLTNQLLL
jgi:hypothetical protein